MEYDELLVLFYQMSRKKLTVNCFLLSINRTVMNFEIFFNKQYIYILFKWCVLTTRIWHWKNSTAANWENKGYE